MKLFILGAIFLSFFVSIAYSQKPPTAGRPRRGLDQIDLLNMDRSPERVLDAVTVDAETFKLLAPLIEHCKQLENAYAKAIINNGLSRVEDYDNFGPKTAAVPRSIFLIKQMQEMTPVAKEILDRNGEVARDVTGVLGTLRAGDADNFKKEISQLFEQYGITESGDYTADRQQLVSAMLRRLNANFSRFRVAG